MSLSAVLVGMAGARLFSARAGLIAGLGLAIYAPAIFFDGLIQKSVLDVAFVSVALAAIAAILTGGQDRRGWWLAVGARDRRAEPDPRKRPAAGRGARPLDLDRCAAPPPRPRRRDSAPSPSASALVLGPVVARNYAVSGGIYLTTSQFGPNFYIGNNAAADGSYVPLRFGRGSPEFERIDATELAERAAGRTLSPAEVSGYWTSRALAFIRSQPGAWLALQGRKAALLVNAAEMIDTESQESHAEWSWPLRALGPLTHFGVLVPLAVVGLWLTWPDRRRLWVLYAIGATFAITTLAFYVFARYRFPLVPLLVLFAGAGIAGCAAGWRAWPRIAADSPWRRRCRERRALSGAGDVDARGRERSPRPTSARRCTTTAGSTTRRRAFDEPWRSRPTTCRR